MQQVVKQLSILSYVANPVISANSVRYPIMQGLELSALSAEISRLKNFIRDFMCLLDNLCAPNLLFLDLYIASQANAHSLNF